MIKKLQDAYDCDLDLGDTVGAIFEGETDIQMRMIKVVPSFINRDFSIPATSNLRPISIPKRSREGTEGRMIKRRRLEEENRELVDVDPVRDQPMISTETDRSGESDVEGANMHTQTGGDRPERSRTADSLVFVDNSRTGNEEFGAHVKEESPELGSPLSRTIPESPWGIFKKPHLPASRLPAVLRQHTRSPAPTPRQTSARVVESNRELVGIVQSEDLWNQEAQGNADTDPAPPEDTREAAVHDSPRSTPEQSEIIASKSTSPRENVCRRPSSPPFMRPRSKPTATYSRSPIITRDTSLLNSSRPRPTSAQRKPNGLSSLQQLRASNAHSFQTAEADEIESTPPETVSSMSGRDTHVENTNPIVEEPGMHTNGTLTPKESAAPKPKKVGSLIRPKQLAYTMGNTPKTFKGRTDPELRSMSASTSTSTDSGVASMVSSNAQATTTVSLHKTLPRPTSPMVLIPKKATLLAPVLEVQTSPGAQDSLESGSQGEIRSTPSRPSPMNCPTNALGLEQPAQKDVVSLLVKENVRPRRTPIPLPPNVRHLVRLSGTPNPREGIEIPTNPVRPAKPRGRQKRSAVVNKDVEPPTEGDRLVPSNDSTSMVDQQPRVLEESTSDQQTPEADSFKRPMRKSKVPLPSNIQNLDTSIPPPAKTVEAGSEASTIITAPTSSKKRGRPPKNATPGRRGRPLKSSTVASVPSKVASGAPISAAELSSSSLTPSKATSLTPSEVPTRVNGINEDGTILPSGSSSTNHSDTDAPPAPVAISRTPGVSRYSPNSTNSIQKKHDIIMKRVFPMGHEMERKMTDMTEQHLGVRPKTPTVRKAKRSLDIVKDVEPPLDPELNYHNNPFDLESRLQAEAANDFTETLQSPEPRLETSSGLDHPHITHETPAKPTLRNSNSWGFGAMDQLDDAVKEADAEVTSGSHPKSPSNQELEGTIQSELEDEDGDEDVTKSKSVSLANSARSSPEVSRRPARFLSHSPTPEKSDSDNESETSRSRSHSRAASPKLVNGNKYSDADDSSDNSSVSSDAESEEDVDMPNATNAEPPSSPPSISPQPQPVTLVPATQSSQLRNLSQPTHRNLRVPTSSNTPLAPATQPTPSVSSRPTTLQSAAKRRSAYAGFPTIQEQLTELRANPMGARRTKNIDARTVSLGKLKRGKGLLFGAGDSSEEEDDSSSSSSEEESPKKPSCSVA
jgi:hypothetical protein